MKNYIIAIALALVLIMGVAAFAEATEATVDPVPAATEPAVEANAEIEKVEDDSAALKEAMDALFAAREDKKVSELEDELNGYVEAGSLTQEQADLILNDVKEKLAAKNGECPNCGYQLRDDAPGMGGQWQRGGNRMNGFGNQQMPRMNGNRMNGGQMPDAQNGATPRQGCNRMNGNQQMPQMNGNQQMPVMPNMQ